jgi:D-alanine-D-alanine ligase
MTDRGSDVGGPVAVLHGAVAPDARKDEQDVLVQVRAVSDSLKRLGFEPSAVALDLDLQAAADSLRSLRPRLVFNLVESIGGRDRLQTLAPLLLESLHLPYTGCSSTAMASSGTKLSAKGLLRRAGLPTPPWAVPVEISAGTACIEYPALLKSVWDHASFGLEEVYESAPQLARALERRWTRSGRSDLPPAEELFAESYVEGREFNLSLLEAEDGVETLPPAEMRFVDYPEGKPRIVGYAAKWDEGSFEYNHTVRSFDFDTPDETLLGRLAELARRCWELFELSGYARVDFRVDAGGRAWILEVNANPCLSPDAGFVAAAERAGFHYDEVVGRLVRTALRRGETAGSPQYAPAQDALSPDRASDSPATAQLVEPAQTPPEKPPKTVLRERVQPGDVDAVRAIVVSSGFFSESEIQLATELVQERLERGEASGYHFLFADSADRPGEPVGYTCFGPIPCTSASYDLYWIAIRGSGRGHGLGTELLRQSEQRIRRLGGRRIYVETSSRPQYAPTRGFYASRGYRVETVLADFYSPGDGKVIFVKELE